jgi:hypothetical protein
VHQLVRLNPIQRPDDYANYLGWETRSRTPKFFRAEEIPVNVIMMR